MLQIQRWSSVIIASVLAWAMAGASLRPSDALAGVPPADQAEALFPQVEPEKEALWDLVAEQRAYSRLPSETEEEAHLELLTLIRLQS